MFIQPNQDLILLLMSEMNSKTGNLEKAIDLLNQGELVVIPTETVYGLAANGLSEVAVKKIFKTKGRPSNNPLILHIGKIGQLKNLVTEFNNEAQALAEAFWPGPLTLVLPKSENVPNCATAGKSTVGIRMPNHPLTLELLQSLDFPLAAPSANRSNHISPTRPEHVRASLKQDAPFILDGGDCKSGIESTIVGFENGTPIIYRLGLISAEEIEAVLSRKVDIMNKGSELKAPGMSKKHYSPQTPLVLTSNIIKSIKSFEDKKIVLLYHSDRYSSCSVLAKFKMSEENDIKVAASNLYSLLYKADEIGADVIIVESFDEQGIGMALNDRLKRAATN